MRLPETMRKILAATLGGLIIIGGAYAPVTAPRAQAIFGVGDVVFDPANYLTNAAQTLVVQTLNGLAWAVAKTAIQSMTKSIVNWINSGYQGEPAFSQNLNRDLRQVGDQASNIFLLNLKKTIAEGAFQSPFVSQVAQLSVNAYLLATSEDKLVQRLRYTLLDYTQDSVAYMRGDWSQGGLSAWHSLIFQCGNDPDCVRFSTQEELINQIDAETQAWLADFNNGRGFLSWKGECQAYQLSTALNQDPAVPLDDSDTCVSYDVLTPGAVVESTLGITVSSPLRQLELADSINEIVGAAVTQLVSTVLGGTGLAGASSPRSNGNPRPIDQVTNPNNTSPTIADGFESIVQSEIDKTNDFKTAWSDIGMLATEAKESCTVAGGVVGIARMLKIQDAEKRANAAVARADNAITELTSILTLLATPDEDGLFENSQTTTSQRAWERYQRLLTGNTLISGQEQAEAAIERSEAASSDSLYLEMQGYVNDCD